MKPKTYSTPATEAGEDVVAAGRPVGVGGEGVQEQADDEEDGRDADGDEDRAIMRPRRLRSSMIRVAIMAGGGDPRSPVVGPGPPMRWQCRAGARQGHRRHSRVPQSARDLQEPRFERGLDLLEPVDRDAPFDEDPVDLGDDVAGGPGRQGDAQPQLAHLDAGPDGGGLEQAPGPVGLGAFDLEVQRGPGQQLGDGALADDVAPVHDGHRVTGALDLVEEVRGQHHGAALGHERQDHVAHLVHAGRVEPVHGLVQDEQLGVARADRRPPPGAGACPWSTSTPGRRRGAGCPTRSRAGPMRSRAAGSRAAARIWRFWRPVRWPWKRGSSTMAPTRARACGPVLGHGVAEQRHRARIGVGQAQQDPDEGGLAGPVGAEVAEGAAPGDEQLHAVHGDVVPEPLGQPVGLHGPLAVGRPGRSEEAGSVVMVIR